MPTYKTLGQEAPAAGVVTDLYTAGTPAVGSTLFVCNRAATQDAYRLAIRPAGATLAAKHYIAYDTPLSGNATDPWTAGITLAAGDVVTVRSRDGNLSFTLCGAENPA